MPVVRVDNVGTRPFGRRRGGTSEKDEALYVVGIVAAALTVNSVTIEEAGMLDQVKRYTICTFGAQDAERLALCGERYAQPIGERLDCNFFEQWLIARQDHARVRARPLQFLRQRTDHVREPARLGMRPHFSGDNRDLHGFDSNYVARAGEPARCARPTLRRQCIPTSAGIEGAVKLVGPFGKLAALF